MHGHGRYVDADGGEHEGVWVDGVCPEVDFTHIPESGNFRYRFSVRERQTLEPVPCTVHIIDRDLSCQARIEAPQPRRPVSKKYFRASERETHATGRLLCGPEYVSPSFNERTAFAIFSCSFLFCTYLLHVLFVWCPEAKGGTYEGDWVNRVSHGQGRMVYSDGSVYVGGWKDFKFHGHGKLAQKEGVVFEGEWLEGRMHGSGRVRATDSINAMKERVEREQQARDEGAAKCKGSPPGGKGDVIPKSHEGSDIHRSESAR